MAVVFVAYWGLGPPRAGAHLAERPPARGQRPVLRLGPPVVPGAALLLGHPRLLRGPGPSRGTGAWRDYLADAVARSATSAILAYFKYFNFFVEQRDRQLRGAGAARPTSPPSRSCCPVGVSFYTFQTLSYSIDVVPGRARCRGADFLDYLVYVTFFPSSWPGPSNARRSLLPQVERAAAVRHSTACSTGCRSRCGEGSRSCASPTRSRPTSTRCSCSRSPAGPMVWAAAIAFSIQIFADFSGYTDIARGTARMLGFELTRELQAQPVPRRHHPRVLAALAHQPVVLDPRLRDGAPAGHSESRLSLGRFVGATMVTFVHDRLLARGERGTSSCSGPCTAFWMAAYTLVGRAYPGWPDRHLVRVRAARSGVPLLRGEHGGLAAVPGDPHMDRHRACTSR